MKATVGLHNLKIDCVMGVHPHERDLIRPIFVDAALDAENAAAAASDNIADTVNYEVIADILTRIAVDGRFRLLEAYIERAAQELANALPQVTRIRLEVRKPGAVPAATDSFVCIDRAT